MLEYTEQPANNDDDEAKGPVRVALYSINAVGEEGWDQRQDFSCLLAFLAAPR